MNWMKHKGEPTQQDFGPLYSNENAVGLVMATGNVGDALRNDVVNTYFSRDGGLTWEQVGKYNSIQLDSYAMNSEYFFCI
jgi:hypothetical protein